MDETIIDQIMTTQDCGELCEYLPWQIIYNYEVDICGYENEPNVLCSHAVHGIRSRYVIPRVVKCAYDDGCGHTVLCLDCLHDTELAIQAKGSMDTWEEILETEG